MAVTSLPQTAARPEGPHAHLFPPALVPVLRDRFDPEHGVLTGVADDLLVHLLTTVFFAGLETYEGERNPVRVVFVGKKPPDLVMPEGEEPGAAPIYRWKILRFVSPRPFVVRELVKLGVATADERIFAAVRVLDAGKLAITGLAREGVNGDGDPFVKVVVSRPGGLSIRSGRDRILEYEHGAILTGGEDVVLSAGPVRRALESTAGAAGLDQDAVPDYLDTVRALVREMAAHGRGGILIINDEEHPAIARTSPYRMVPDSSLAPLLRLSRLLGRKDGRARTHPPDRKVRRASEQVSRSDTVAFRHLLRNSFLSEAERTIEELGALTGIDGATVLNRDLALIAFGVILPVTHEMHVVEAMDPEGAKVRAVDLGSRGTRHRAGATYAEEHPGSVVFVASEDGQVTCMFRGPKREQVLLWRLGPAAVHAA